MNKEKGFTLIELVVVIAILAILASFALPKFADLSDAAHEASVQSTGGSFVSAINLVRAQWLANGVRNAVTNLPGYGEPNNLIDVSLDGWATGVNGNTDPSAMTAAECNALWEELMTTSSVSVATVVGSDYLTDVNAGDCRYTYQLTINGHNVEYDPNTGDVHTAILP
ncbi:MAG: MSHA pilin protein MshB [Oleiphilaceae bacterium]|jgi:prepilin-type N-terminal cleavage/methylation domain-containing protein